MHRRNCIKKTCIDLPSLSQSIGKLRRKKPNLNNMSFNLNSMSFNNNNMSFNNLNTNIIQSSTCPNLHSSNIKNTSLKPKKFTNRGLKQYDLTSTWIITVPHDTKRTLILFTDLSIGTIKPQNRHDLKDPHSSHKLLPNSR